MTGISSDDVSRNRDGNGMMRTQHEGFNKYGGMGSKDNNSMQNSEGNMSSGDEQIQKQQQNNRRSGGSRAKGLGLKKKGSAANDLIADTVALDAKRGRFGNKSKQGGDLLDLMDATKHALETQDTHNQSGIPNSDVEISVNEKLFVMLDRDGILKKFEIKGYYYIYCYLSVCGAVI